MPTAYSIQVRGVVQGVGFRPFIYRLASANHLKGWVLNGEDGVEIHLEGKETSLQSFLDQMKSQPPQAAEIAELQVTAAEEVGFAEFTIRESTGERKPTVRISPDLPVCENCLQELFDPRDPRYLYPYMNCTDCGPRFSVIRSLPYDRANTTMAQWSLDDPCAAEYGNPENRRFHAQPVACPRCGPHFLFHAEDEVIFGDGEAIERAIEFLLLGRIVAMKGIGGYHLACDAKNPDAVLALRNRKFRKEKPFALMVKNLAVGRELVGLTPEEESLMGSVARPIVLGTAKAELPGVAPENCELGVMLP
ncbi:MAG: acylphosphatase, partial [Candidatus Acidiferrales bacterium]